MTVTVAEELQEVPLSAELAAPLLPRVDLLPPEIGARRRLRRVQTGLGGAVLATLGVAGLLTLSAHATVAERQAELDALTATAAGLRAEQAAFAPVVETRQRAEQAEQVLAEAMGEEVRFSALLDTLGRSTPDGVWIAGLTLTQDPTAPVPGTAPAATPAAPVAAGAAPTLGTAEITAVGFDHDHVADWLDSLATAPGFTAPGFTSSTGVLRGERPLVEFSTTARLTTDALSGRYAPKGG